MKISYNWLKDFVDFGIEPYDLAEKLTLVGFEVEEVVKKSLDFPNIVIGKVLKREQHPNADKLTVCQVAVNGGEPLSTQQDGSDPNSRIHGFLKHSFFIADDHIRRTHVDHFLQTVISIKDAAVKIV